MTKKKNEARTIFLFFHARSNRSIAGSISPFLLSEIAACHARCVRSSPMLTFRGFPPRTPSRTAAPFWGQPTWNLTGLSPTWDFTFRSRKGRKVRSRAQTKEAFLSLLIKTHKTQQRHAFTPRAIPWRYLRSVYVSKGATVTWTNMLRQNTGNVYVRRLFCTEWSPGNYCKVPRAIGEICSKHKPCSDDKQRLINPTPIFGPKKRTRRSILTKTMINEETRPISLQQQCHPFFGSPFKLNQQNAGRVSKTKPPPILHQVSHTPKIPFSALHR